MIDVELTERVDKNDKALKFSTSYPQVENLVTQVLSLSYPQNTLLYYGYCLFLLIK